MHFDRSKPNVLPLAIQGPGDPRPILYQDLSGLAELAAVLEAAHPTLSGLIRSIQLEIPQRATYAYDTIPAYRAWLDCDAPFAQAVEIGDDGQRFFVIRPGKHCTAPVDKARFLIDLSEEIDGHVLVGAVTAAASVLFNAGELAESERVLTDYVQRYGHPLFHSALRSVAIVAQGRKLPPQFEDVLGESSYFADRFCELPFTSLHVEDRGNLYVCNSNHLGIPVGNVTELSGADAVHSSLADSVRASILDGSFRYCNRHTCPRILGGTLPKRSEAAKDPKFGPIIAAGESSIQSVDRFIPYIPFLLQMDLSSPPIPIASRKAVSQLADAVEARSPAIAALMRGIMMDLDAANSVHAYASIPFYEEWLASDDNAMELTTGRPYEWAPPLPLIRPRSAPGDASMSKVEFILLINRMREDRPYDVGPAQYLIGAVYCIARHLYRQGQYAEAQGIVARQLSLKRHFLLEPAKRVLDLVMAGRPVPPHLEDVLGTSDYYEKRFCSLPFSEMTIGVRGESHICCPSYLNIETGNIRSGDMAEVLNSTAAQLVRASILDGSFKYCNRIACSFIAGDRLPTREQARQNPWLRRVIDEQITRLDRIRRMSVALDQTCNLSCPSCRSSLIIEKGPELEWKKQAVRETIMPMLRDCELLQMAGYGEFAMSEPCRMILKDLNEAEFPALKLDLITNALLFDKSFWSRYPNVHNMIHNVRVSVDGATKPTYEKLRRGGSFERFTQNMEFIAELRRDGTIPSVGMLFVYQFENFEEMPMMVEWALRLGIDSITFEKILDWSSFESASGYQEAAVHLPTHPRYSEFLEVISDPIFRDPVVARDWN